MFPFDFQLASLMTEKKVLEDKLSFSDMKVAETAKELERVRTNHKKLSMQLAELNSNSEKQIKTGKWGWGSVPEAPRLFVNCRDLVLLVGSCV